MKSPRTPLEIAYAKFDRLYQGIDKICRKCRYPDCMGYIWLLKAEAHKLYKSGVPLVQVNDGPTFIHSFRTKRNGTPILSDKYPVCSQLCKQNRHCGIHQNRPLICHLYPLGLETTPHGKIVWVLHLDCLYIKKLEKKRELQRLKRKIRYILNNLSPRLLREIIATYKAVDAISKFPDGENNYCTIKEGDPNVKVQISPR